MRSSPREGCGKICVPEAVNHQDPEYRRSQHPPEITHIIRHLSPLRKKEEWKKARGRSTGHRQQNSNNGLFLRHALPLPAPASAFSIKTGSICFRNNVSAASTRTMDGIIKLSGPKSSRHMADPAIPVSSPP